MRTKDAASRAIGQRVGLLAFVASLVLAPALANIWPAFGKGEMLYVGEPSPADHSAHQGHHHPGVEAGKPRPHDHKAHCALCVVAFLGWAPPVDLNVDSGSVPVAEPPVAPADAAPCPLLLWPRAQARAPPHPLS